MTATPEQVAAYVHVVDQLAKLRDGIAALAAELDASAAATRPSRKSTIEDECAIALRQLLEDA